MAGPLHQARVELGEEELERERYVAAFEKITGEEFVPNEEEPMARLAKNLARFLG